jgi:hypothetical protein
MLYDYFKATPASTNYQEKKLRLLNVQESACDGTIILPKYQLQYEGDMLPSTWSHATDHWGYYNGKDNNLENIPPTTLFDGITSITYGTADRETNETYMKRGVLKKMIYPTGGFAEFTTEANDYKTTLTASSSNLVSLSAPPCRSFDMSANLPAFTAAQLPTLQYYIKHIPPPYPLPSCPANSPVYTYTLQLFQQATARQLLPTSSITTLGRMRTLATFPPCFHKYKQCFDLLCRSQGELVGTTIQDHSTRIQLYRKQKGWRTKDIPGFDQ